MKMLVYANFLFLIMKTDWSKENLEKIIKNNTSIRGCLLDLNALHGSSYATFKRKIEKYNLDISHFTGQEWSKGEKGTDRVSKVLLEEILNENTNYSSSRLLDRLVYAKMKEYKCEVCGISTWQNKDIRLELHHINGNHYDNRFENLQILCPNCHSQTVNHRRKGEHYNSTPPKALSLKTKIEPKTCIVCGKTFKPDHNGKGKYCSRECYLKDVRENSQARSSWSVLADKKEDVLAQFNNYKTLTDLAAHFGVNRTTLSEKMRHWGIFQQFKDLHNKIKPKMT